MLFKLISAYFSWWKGVSPNQQWLGLRDWRASGGTDFGARHSAEPLGGQKDVKVIEIPCLQR